MKTIIKTMIFGLLLTISCQENQTKKPKVSYQKSGEKVVVKKEKTSLEIADLPMQFAGSNVLIYTIGDINLGYNKGGSYDGNNNFRISNTMDNEVTGFISNLKFQQMGQDSLKPLTDKNIIIERFGFLKNQNKIVYSLYDEDTNQDNEIDGDDIKALYFSNENGTDFTKITENLHEIIDYKMIENLGLLFYRTIIDSNKNGKIDDEDKMHYYKYNLTKKIATEYNPI
jgi:hypothetical protein